MTTTPVRLVLLRPRNPDNVGAVARAMKNFGLTDWVLVSPGFDSIEPARRLAVHAGDLIDSVRRADTLTEAVQDCVWVVGTSSRRVRGKRRLSAREAAKEIAERSMEGTVALVFGDERSGLTNEDVDRCHDLSAIAAEDAQPSLNLAQAAMLYCYELHQARRALAPPPPAPDAPLATDAELHGVEDALGRLLQAGGFLRADAARAVRELFAPLRRSRLRRKEAAMWRAALESVAKRLGPPPGAR
ncbi:MAG: rRNA methyltransferase [Myxococcaceae bacterium]|nr:rRNA methyltransferase [Myxococcaceae bacterium]